MEGEDAQPRALLFGQSPQGGWDHPAQIPQYNNRGKPYSQCIPLKEQVLVPWKRSSTILMLATGKSKWLREMVKTLEEHQETSRFEFFHISPISFMPNQSKTKSCRLFTRLLNKSNPFGTVSTICLSFCIIISILDLFNSFLLALPVFFQTLFSPYFTLKSQQSKNTNFIIHGFPFPIG